MCITKRYKHKLTILRKAVNVVIECEKKENSKSDCEIEKESRN